MKNKIVYFVYQMATMHLLLYVAIGWIYFLLLIPLWKIFEFLHWPEIIPVAIWCIQAPIIGIYIGKHGKAIDFEKEQFKQWCKTLNPSLYSLGQRERAAWKILNSPYRTKDIVVKVFMNTAEFSKVNDEALDILNKFYGDMNMK